MVTTSEAQVIVVEAPKFRLVWKGGDAGGVIFRTGPNQGREAVESIPTTPRSVIKVMKPVVAGDGIEASG